MRVTVLGCGGSGGVPMLDLGWGDCDPSDPRNRRLRPSILVDLPGQGGADPARVLVDTSPDLRQQLLNADIGHLDAILFTHAHADHTHGIDDLRPINRNVGGPIDAYGDGPTLDALHQRFGYCFLGIEPGQVIYRPWLKPHLLTRDEVFEVAGVPVQWFEQDHGWMTSIGYRLGNFAYSTDVIRLPDEAFDILEGVDTWMIGCLGGREHPTHAHVDQVLEWVERVKPKRAFLTHMSIGLDYETLCETLPAHVRPAHDGLIIDV